MSDDRELKTWRDSFRLQLEVNGRRLDRLLSELRRELFGHHHESLRVHFDRRLNELQQELKTMSASTESLDQRLADTTALVQKLSDDSAKFRADVKTALAALGNAGPLTPAQQAQFDNLISIATATDTATTDADAALNPAPAPAA